MGQIDYVNTVIPIVKQAGRKISNNFRFKRTIEEKGVSNYVTDLDQKIERFIINSIQEKYNNQQFISEEGIVCDCNEDYWILDPLDGTTNLIHNYRSVCISLAHVIQGEVVFGVVYAPMTKELFYAEKGCGAFLVKNRTKMPIRASIESEITSSMIGFGCPYDKRKIDCLFELLKKLLLKCDDIKRVGPASLDICYVACGRLDAYLEFDLEIWDYSAGLLILKEAGGVMTNLKGQNPGKRKSDILASNGVIHPKILKELGTA